jgi:hypothetical protein
MIWVNKPNKREKKNPATRLKFGERLLFKRSPVYAKV